MGSADGPGAENNLISVDGEHLFAAYDKQPSGPIAIEYDAVDEAIWADGEVEAVTGGAQVADGGAHPDTVYDVECEGADTGAVGAIVVGAVWEAFISGSLVEGALVGRPLILGMTAAHDWAVVAVEFVSEVLVGLHALEVGEHVFEGPFWSLPHSAHRS